MILVMLLNLCIAPVNFLLISRKNLDWGIPDLCLIIGEDSVAGIFLQCFHDLPISVLIAKLCPKRIEATGYAVVAGAYNISFTMKQLLGTLINDSFVGVTKDDITNYWVLIMISTLC